MRYENVQSVNRVYASKDKTLGGIYKVKTNQVKKVKLLTPSGNVTNAWQKRLTPEQIQEVLSSVEDVETEICKNGRCMQVGSYHYDALYKAGNTPENCLIDNANELKLEDIDKEYYINLAKKRINDFMGGNTKMATAKTKETKETKDLAQVVPAALEVDLTADEIKAVNLYRKIHLLQKYFDKVAPSFEKDGYNSHQKYEYVKASQYKNALRKGCLEIGLAYRLAVTNIIPITLAKDSSMTAIAVQGQIYLTDIDTTQTAVYPVIGMGADSLDKQISKAETLLIKDFIKSNFLVDDNENDPEADVQVTQVVTSKAPATPAQRDKLKTEVIANSANREQDSLGSTIEYLNGLIKKIRMASGNDAEASKTEATINAVDENGKYIVDSLNLKRITLTIEGRADELGVL